VWIFLAYLVGCLSLALAAFYVATVRPERARLLWRLAAAFVILSGAFVAYVASSPALVARLLRFG
jgi:hypothetical protein